MRKFLAKIFLQIPIFRRYRHEALLARFSRAASDTDSADRIYAAINSLVKEVAQFDRIAIHFVDPSSETLIETFVTGHEVRAWGLQTTRPIAGTVTEEVIKSSQSFVIDDCGSEWALRRFPNLKMSSSLLPSLVCIPMVSAGVPVGAVSLRSGKKGEYSPRKVKALEKLVAHVTPTLVNSRDWAASRREVQEQATLAEIGRLAGSTIDIGSVWDKIVSSVKELIHFERMVLAIVEEDGETITDTFVCGIPLPNWDENPKRKRITVPADKIIRGVRSEIVGKEENDAAHIDLLGYVMSERVGFKSTMYTPLVGGGKVIGTLSVRALKENAFSEEDKRLFEQVATLIGGPVAIRELYKRSQRLTDETESRIRLELENKKLEELNQTKARFISMVSHELRTPLTSMIAFTDIIGQNRNNSLSERDLTHLEVVKRNGSRLRLLIEDLLAMSEIDSGDISIAKSEFSLKESIDQLADSIEPILTAKNQKLTISFSNPDITLVSDRIRLEQILANLVSNASKYSANDSEIKIDIAVENKRVRIAVIDQGEGIAEDEIPLLFDEFSRLDNDVTRANQGSGLGLAISRRLAAALGGTIDVSSKRNEGSVFTVTLPDDLPKAA